MKKYRLCVLSLMICGALLFSGCRGNNEPAAGDSTDETADSDFILYETPESAAFAVVRGEKLSSDVSSAASSLAKAYQALGVNTAFYDEYRYAESNCTHAIFVGQLTESRATDAATLALCAQFQSELRVNDFVIRAAEGNLFILGGSDAATIEGVRYFIENLLTRTQFTKDYCLRMSDNYELPDLSVNGVSVSQYSIIYDSVSVFSEQRAREIQQFIKEKAGFLLPVRSDFTAESEYEILIGQTNREISQSLIDEFALPHIFYSVIVSDSKLVLASDGVRTATAACEQLETFISALSADASDISPLNLNLQKDVTSVDRDMYRRADGTDLRIMHSNVLNFTGEGNDNGFTARQRAELLTDVYLYYLPDVITFNELMDKYEIARHIQSLLKPYYIFADIRDETGTVENLQTGDVATKIAYRCDIDMKMIHSGVVQLVPSDSFHTISWILSETATGERFLVLDAHYIENRDSNGKWISDYAKIATDLAGRLRGLYGDIPVIMTGDWYFWSGSAPYVHVLQNGYCDASVSAEKLYSKGLGTYHVIGDSQTGVNEDLCFYSPGHLTALAHKAIRSYYTINGSDHLPVVVDFRFVGSD